MKKIVFGLLTFALVLLLSGCYFFVPLTATVTIENNTDYTFVYLADYNNSTGWVDPWILEPQTKEELTLKGKLTEANYSDSTESFAFYCLEKESFEARLKEDASNDKHFVLTNAPGSCSHLSDKRSQVYHVVIDPAETGYTVTLSCEQ